MGDKRKQDNRGFSLVEVVVSAAILAIIGSVILGSFSMAVRMNARAKQTYRAANYAQKAMEYLMTDDEVETKVERAVQEVCSNASVASLAAAGDTLSWDKVSEAACNAAQDYWPNDADSWSNYWTDHSYNLGIDAGSSDSVTVNSVSVGADAADNKKINVTFEVTAIADSAEVTLSGKRTIKLELTQSTPGL
ncbi:MAG: type II secretion system GspH family protein [Lachnospiraceae bacterium]|nr:type II secretion system GspH family protein [Lachnospiraceae bacterium]